jgi:type IV pilus assembly protein PilV
MKNNEGFTLIEVLISMLVLAVGLLGLAGLQATGIRNNLSAHYRSQASMLAYDIADRMRANLVTAQNRDVAGNMQASMYNSNVTLPTAANLKANCTQLAGACSPTLMAENDLAEWNAAVELLPLGEGTITSTIQGVAPNQVASFRVTINWDDNRDTSVNASDPSFIMGFEI